MFDARARLRGRCDGRGRVQKREQALYWRNVRGRLVEGDDDAGLPQLANTRYWKEEDYCGYWIETKDGTIWMPGDSRLLGSHLHMSDPDVILFDFADNEWHITLEGAIELANAYPDADLICIHWGTVDAPDMTPFNGDPMDLMDRIVHPERIHVLAPGEAFVLKGEEKRYG